MPYSWQSFFRQDQRKSLTCAISVIMCEVNEKRWQDNGATLPLIVRCTDALAGQGGPHERGRSA